MDDELFEGLSVAEMIGRTADAISTAVAEHGDEALELSLLAYQLDAIRALIFPFLAVVLGGIGWFLVARAFWRKARHHQDEKEFSATADTVLAGILVCGVAGILWLFLLAKLLNPALIAAAFGNPEVYIATQALRAAGLM